MSCKGDPSVHQHRYWGKRDDAVALIRIECESEEGNSEGARDVDEVESKFKRSHLEDDA